MAKAGNGKAAFVTGAASGIGRATAEAFLARGYATVLVDRDEAAGRRAEAELRQAGECLFVACDVADDASVRRAVEQAVAAYGRLDAAFNAAGVGGDFGPFTASATIENWRRVMDVDLTGVWFCMRHQIPELLKTGGGSIVNCASLAGLRGAEGLSAYAAAKHGVVGLTKTAALEYASQGLRINAVCPGMVDTPMAKDVTPKVAAVMNALTPLGRFATPAEVATAVLWLCDENNSFVTGQAIAVDGGRSAR
jgi:NAD(P)-dependent dehydrogenase (short-subunit alcohol dehydrogenase family)